MAVLSALGSIASLVGIGWVFYSVYVIKRSIRINFSYDLRRIIEAIDRQKAPFLNNHIEAYNVLFNLQGELEVFNKKILETFSMKDIRNNGIK